MHSYAFPRVLCRGHRDPNIHIVDESGGPCPELHAWVASGETEPVVDARAGLLSVLTPTGGGILLPSLASYSNESPDVPCVSPGSEFGVEAISEVNLENALLELSAGRSEVGAMRPSTGT